LHCDDLFGASQQLRSYQLAGEDEHERESRFDRLTVAVVHGAVINTAGSPMAGVKRALPLCCASIYSRTRPVRAPVHAGPRPSWHSSGTGNNLDKAGDVANRVTGVLGGL